MIEKTVVDLFHYYLGFWVVELGLTDKYKFQVKKDNRINAFADVGVESPYNYLIRFNAKHYNQKWQIIHVVLHELGHLLYDFRSGHEGEHEYVAEHFALSKAKIYYPEFYPKMVEQTKKYVLSKKSKCEDHRYGYRKALMELGELEKEN